MFKFCAKNLFLLCLLIKKKSAVYSADRCNFSEPETDCSRDGNNLYKSWVEGALNSGPFGHFRFANHHFNWQILVKVWTSVIGLSCLLGRILEMNMKKSAKFEHCSIGIWWKLCIKKLTRRIKQIQIPFGTLLDKCGGSFWTLFRGCILGSRGSGRF